MEVLKEFKRNGFFGTDIYYILLGEKKTHCCLEMTPSTFLREMRLSSYERIPRLYNLDIDNINGNAGLKSNTVLSFSPKLLLFQNFQPNDKIMVKFTVKNISQATTYISMVFKESSYFSIKPRGTKTSRLAPGMSYGFTVIFTPTQYEDYQHKVSFFTDNEKYVLPIIALGPRPLFDFPDIIIVPPAALKIENSCAVTITNIGQIPAGFSLKTKCPFYVKPKSAYLCPGEKVDVTVTFKSMHIEEFFGILVASYETGEKFCIHLKGTTYPVPVHLEKQVVRFLETYNTLMRQVTLKVHNESSHELSYVSMQYETVRQDFSAKMKLATQYQGVCGLEQEHNRKLREYEVLCAGAQGPAEQRRVYARLYADELQALALDDSFLFHHAHFSIQPAEGKLWPNTSTEVTIIFSPMSIGEFEATAFLDIDGVEGRIPLVMKGTSLPPSIKLNVETLDMDRLYINRICNYEIVAMNKGHINGVLLYNECPTLFGSRITCTPEMHCLEPGGMGIFVISFLNPTQGPFFEEIHFNIKDTDITLRAYLKGEMVFPSLSFSTSILDFGFVSLGVPSSMEFEIVNESTIEVNVDIKMLSDGPELNSISLADYEVIDPPKPNLPEWPKEFQIVPHKIMIKPESNVLVKITLTANLIRANQTSIEVELENADSPPFILPARYNANVPRISTNGDIHLKNCFLNYDYKRDIIFVSNEYTGYFVLESEIEDPTALELKLLKDEGYIEPNSVTKIPIELKTTALGLQSVILRMRLFGMKEAIDICNITLCGVKPIVTYSPLALSWGHVKLLTRVEKTLVLYNDSPVSADFLATVVNNDGAWRVNMSDGTILPESTSELVLSLCLSNSGSYQNKLLIKIENLQDILIPLSAVGVGTSIVVGELRDHVVAGRHFTKIPMHHNVTITNCGTRLHTLEWSTQYKQAKNKPVLTPMFTLEPSQFKMSAGEKLNLKISAASNKPTVIKENWFLIGSVEGINKKELLMECMIEAEFVDPKIEISTDSINLRYDFGPYSEYYNLTDIFTIKNVSKLPLDMEISVHQPFTFIQRSNGYKIAEGDGPFCGCICYNTEDLNVETLMHETEPYVAKQFIDYVTEKPVPPIRNDYLKFFQEINKLKLAFNLTQVINQVLEDEETMRLQIVFDTTKHCSLKSKHFTDYLRIKFKKLNNKDQLKVTGQINFPNLMIFPSKLDFQCILNGSTESKTIKLTNDTPLTVCYQFQWKIYTFGLPEALSYNLLEELTPARISLETDVVGNDFREIMSATTPPVSNHDKISTKGGDGDKKSISLRGDVDSTSTSCKEAVVLKDEKTELLKTILPMLSIEDEHQLDWLYKFPKSPQSLPEVVNDLFKVMPHRGILKPGASEYVHITFSPKTDVKVKAQLDCNVLGGPTESITVLGTSSDLHYDLNTEVIDFKIRTYNEKASEEFSILNTALVPFQYVSYLEPYALGEFYAKILEISPPYKYLGAFQDVVIDVIIEPGILGYFERSFLIEIGHLQHININVIGWGVFPQVHLTLPRPEMAKVPHEVGYKAIATLTTQYLSAVNDIFEQISPANLNTPQADEINVLSDLDNPEDWYICKEMDVYPSVMDVELAIERILAINYLNRHPAILQNLSQNKLGPIPGLFTVPYVIDYGVVIVGTTIQCSTEVINYGPGPAKLRQAKSSHLPSWLELKMCGRISAGGTSSFHVIFAPTTIHFPEMEEVVQTMFHLEVPWGVSIPVVVKATCAVPYLVTNTKAINFGKVRCGDKMVCSIPVKNIGKSTCIWYVTLKLKNRGPNPITILNSSGKYEPGEGGWIEIAFKPNLEMTYEGILIFRFYMNPSKVLIPVMGHGVIPRVHVIGADINFTPTLPWAETTDLFFGLTNPCVFPIEIMFPHDDEMWGEEENIYQMLVKYYDNPGEMLVPVIKPGCGLPSDLTVFFKNIMDKVKNSLCEDMVASGSARTNTTAKKTPTKISAKGSNTPKTSPSSGKIRSEAELIAEQIEVMKSNGADPLREAQKVYQEVLDEDPSLPFGVLIFTHGSPVTEFHSMELAYSIGKRLNLPVINVDNAIVEALCTVDCGARDGLMTVIDEMYDAIMKTASQAKGDMKSELDIVEEVVDEADVDLFDLMYKKLEMICNTKFAGTPRSKSSDKKTRSKRSTSSANVDLAGTSSALLPVDVLHDLMKEFFSQARYEQGFVVDTLNSMVFKQPPNTLTSVLKFKPNVKTVKLLICHSEFSKWVQIYEEREREKELLEAKILSGPDESEIEQLIKDYDEMDGLEYENVSPELKAIYIELGLEERRNKFLERRNKCEKDFRVLKGASTRSVTIGINESKAKPKEDNNAAFKKTEIKGAKMPSELLQMNVKFNDYQKNTFEQLMLIANNWSLQNCEMGMPLVSSTGQPIGNKEVKPQKKGKSQVQLPNESEMEHTDRGFPVILVTCPCLEMREAILDNFAYCPLILEARRQKSQVDILTLPMNCKEYTVLTPKSLPSMQQTDCLIWKLLNENPIKKCECNPLKELQEFDDTSPENVVNIMSMWHCTCGKKLTSESTSTTEIPASSMNQTHQDLSNHDIYPQPQPLHTVKSAQGYKGRLVLQPGDLVRCKYSFSPQLEGTFSTKRFIDVTGWPDSRAAVNVTAICDLPRLDNRPKKVFGNFSRRTLVDAVYKWTYLDDQKVFEFGPIFIGPQRVYEESAVFKIKNSSLMTCNVSFMFLEDTDVFKVGCVNLNLEVGCKDILQVFAAPAIVGTFSNKLLCCIQNNPEIVTFNVTCSGVLPRVEILPTSKMIDYGKLLLYRREDERFIVKNNSILPIMWKIRNMSEFIEYFIVGETSGVVAKDENQVVLMTYIACQVGIIQLKPLIIDIFDAEGRGEPMITETLLVSAECYDVMVDCAFENPDEPYLNYGNVKVNSPLVKEVNFLNRGKYEIYFKIKKVKNFPEPALLKSMEISKDCGVIPPTMRMVNIQFYCTPTTLVRLHNVPAFMCTLIDGTGDQTVVSKYPICLSIASYYNTFTLLPFGELNFHVIPIGIISTKEIIISNNSKCPITYEIELPDEYAIVNTPSSAAKVKDVKGKDAKNASGMKCGNFTILNEDSILAPGASRTIEVQFFATLATRFEEVIKFVVSDVCPAEAKGVPLKLVGTGAIPTIDIWNLDSTFREHLILKSFRDYKIRETSPHCVFIEDSVTLHYLCVNVNNTYTANIDLYNNGLVTASLTMLIRYQSNTESDIFYLDKESAHIEPLVHRTLGVVFAPKALKEYRAVLEIHLKLLGDQEEVYKICLIGEGVIPRITILEPKFRQLKTSSIQFPSTFLNTLSHKSIVMSNISSIRSTVIMDIVQQPYTGAPPFWLTTFDGETDSMVVMWESEFSTSVQLMLLPNDKATIHVCFTPVETGRASCEVKVLIVNNPYEYFTILCDGESFIEDVTLLGIDMLPLGYDSDFATNDMDSVTVKDSFSPPKKGNKITPKDSKKEKDKRKGSGKSNAIGETSSRDVTEHTVLKYVLDLGGCELNALHKRIAIMVNHSLKAYKFTWLVDSENVVVKPLTGYISPGEEKDIEINFLSDHVIKIEMLNLCCRLDTLDESTLSPDMMSNLWDGRQTISVFEKNRDIDLCNRLEDHMRDPNLSILEGVGASMEIVIVFSAVVEYTKYNCSLSQDVHLKDTLMYQTRFFDLDITNTGNVPMKISWNFQIDEEYPTRIDTDNMKQVADNSHSDSKQCEEEAPSQQDNAEASELTLFSDSEARKSADSWFEVHLPFEINPAKGCIPVGQKRTFRVTFAPVDAFHYKVRLRSFIENLSIEDTSVSIRIEAKSLVPYCHLDVDESDYLTAGRRKNHLPALPPNTKVFEFNVLGAGCYKKKLNIVNPTGEPYNFMFENKTEEKSELVPIHCNVLEGFIDDASTTEVCFTFAPSEPGTYESLWKFTIPQYSVDVDLLVVGIVREPDIIFVPTILTLRQTLVGGSTSSVVHLRNRENENVKFKFTGDSLCNESGMQPVIVEPSEGIVTAFSESAIRVTYAPLASGTTTFKIFCEIPSMVKPLVLCVNAVSHLVKPKVTYSLTNYEHTLRSDVITRLNIEKVASDYERRIRFVIKNEGSIAFEYRWLYVDSAIKKYMDVVVDPVSGHLQPGEEREAVLSFTIRGVPVVGYPITLRVSDGPEYNILLDAEINKPLYKFSITGYDFGKCIMNAPDTTYVKNITFRNNDTAIVTIDCNFTNVPELSVELNPKLMLVQPNKKLKIPVYFRPKKARQYEFVLPFRVNSLCEHNITIKGEGVPLLFDLYEGCQKSINLGAVKVGDKITREVQVMNHSKVPIEASFLFLGAGGETLEDEGVDSSVHSECLSPTTEKGRPNNEPISRVEMLKMDRDVKTKEQKKIDFENAVSALKVIPAKTTILPHQKIPVEIIYKPMGLIKTLNMQLCMKVFTCTKPLVRLNGCAKGLSLSFSQNSLQFGLVRKNCSKTLKIMLLIKGDIATRFYWQPLTCDTFTISPMEGTITSQSSITFNITIHPTYTNPFIKTWAICNIENYHALELALYGCCLDLGLAEPRTVKFRCPVRDTETIYITVTNPTDDPWCIIPAMSGNAFETLSEVHLEPNSVLDVPITFKPRMMGDYEGNVLFSPLGEHALFFVLSGYAESPQPNGIAELDIVCKQSFTESFEVYNLTEHPETFVVQTEVMKIEPPKFSGYYNINCPKIVKCWGEVAATCRWTIVCYEECCLNFKLKFINQENNEYQFYFVVVNVKAAGIEATYELTARARESVQHKVTVTNPLSEDVPYVINTTHPDITVEPTILVPMKSEAQLTVTYSPLVTGSTEGFIEAGHPLVGVFLYKLLLTCLPAKERSIECEAPLGMAVPLRLTLHNRTDKSAEFTPYTTNPSFTVEKGYILGPRDKGKTLVWFEPNNFVQQMGQISFKSPIAGDYVFNVVGTVLEPKPQGPLEIKAGGSTVVTFKNVFEDTRTFKIYVDRDEFSVKTMFETIKPKKDIKVPVYLSKLPSYRAYPTGSLTIACHDPSQPRLAWTYFLQGIP